MPTPTEEAPLTRMRRLRERFYVIPCATVFICGLTTAILGVNLRYDGYTPIAFVLCICLGLATGAQIVHIILLGKHAYEIDSIQETRPAVAPVPAATTYRSVASRQLQYVQEQFAAALGRNGFDVLSVQVGMDFGGPSLSEASPNTIGWTDIGRKLTMSPTAPGRTILPNETLLARSYRRETPHAIYFDGMRYFLLSFGSILPREISPVELDPSAGVIVVYLGATEVGPLA